MKLTRDQRRELAVELGRVHPHAPEPPEDFAPAEADVDQVLAVELGADLEEVRALFADGYSVIEAARLLVVMREAEARERKSDGPRTPARKRPEPRPPARTSSGLVEDLLERARAGEPAAPEGLFPIRFRQPSGPAPRGRSYRSLVNRRHAPRPTPSAWWLRGGTHAIDVKNWLRLGHKSTDPVERALVAAFRKELLVGGEVCWPKLGPIYPLACLAFVLYYARVPSLRKGYCSVVAGKPRGILARLSAHRYRGEPVHADTISRWLRMLRPIVAGVLEWHQPDPEAAERYGLPASTHYLDDGRQLHQAENVYWFRSAAYVEKSGAVSGSPVPSFGPDPGSGYVATIGSPLNDLRSSRGEGARASPAPHSGVPPGRLKPPPDPSSGGSRR